MVQVYAKTGRHANGFHQRYREADNGGAGHGCAQDCQGQPLEPRQTMGRVGHRVVGQRVLQAWVKSHGDFAGSTATDRRAESLMGLGCAL